MRNILVIGGSSGIGKELVTKLQLQNQVFATYNSGSIDNENVVTKQWSASEDFETDWLPEELHGLVYCPGSINLKPFKRYTDEDFKADYELQVLGAVKCIRACYSKLMGQEDAAVVLFSSVAATVGLNYHSLVGSSKSAVEGLVRSLAAEFAPKCRVNAVSLSLTNTPLAQKLLNTPEKIEANGKRHPMGRVGTPSDAVQAVEYLLQNSWVTGQVLQVDGGMSALKV